MHRKLDVDPKVANSTMYVVGKEPDYPQMEVFG